ncbi:MAG: hypothetical protein IT461_10940 [Planctomycetes bacterium]|nr:hypothetical protein [Planctomycetota bacterium]
MNKDNSSLIVGKKIVKVEQLSKRQCDNYGFDWCGWQPVWLITLDDGTQLLPLRDPEGNGPGVIQVQAEPQITELLWSNTICK